MSRDKGVSPDGAGLSSATEPVPVSALRASIPDAYRGKSHAELAGLRKDYAKMIQAAQAARKLADRHMQQIRAAMEAIDAEPPVYEASDHAVVRYLERVKGMDILAIRDEIALECATATAICGENMRASGRAIYVLNSEGFVTTVLPAGALLGEAHRIATRSDRRAPNAKKKRSRRAALAVRDDLAQAMSASGQDPKGLEAKPASAVPNGDAP